jgi:hypothetical protein
MPRLLLTRVLPNPAGKDRTPANQVTNQQLNGEWVEFKNVHDKALDLNGLRVAHYTFTDRCQHTGEDSIKTYGDAVLAAGWSIRLHTGVGSPSIEGTIEHHYLNRRSFVWNNRCGDTAVLRWRDNLLDWACYDPQPPEGAVLNRIPNTNRFDVAHAATGTYGYRRG